MNSHYDARMDHVFVHVDEGGRQAVLQYIVSDLNDSWVAEKLFAEFGLQLQPKDVSVTVQSKTFQLPCSVDSIGRHEPSVMYIITEKGSGRKHCITYESRYLSAVTSAGVLRRQCAIM
jgi:hypothetical protein